MHHVKQGTQIISTEKKRYVYIFDLVLLSNSNDVLIVKSLFNNPEFNKGSFKHWNLFMRLNVLGKFIFGEAVCETCSTADRISLLVCIHSDKHY